MPDIRPLMLRAERQLRPAAFGYDYNDGGLSNQKLTLLGLVLAVDKQTEPRKRRMFLPDLYSKHHDETRSARVPFGDVFFEDVFRDFARRWNIEIVGRPLFFDQERIARGGWTYFGEASCHLADLCTHRRETIFEDLSSDFFRSLVPKVKFDRSFIEICKAIYIDRNINTVAQFRIEEDWHVFCVNHLSHTLKEPEDIYLDPEDISKKIQASVDMGQPSLYVTCDERYLRQPKETIRQNVKTASGIDIFFKSDVGDQAKLSAMNQLNSSIVDFEIAKMAKTYVGNSRSTFSNTLSFERYCANFNKSASDYIYNAPGGTLGRRRDLGTRDTPSAVLAG